MKAYHIRTNELDSHNPNGTERFILDSIYVPEKYLFVGFTAWYDMCGLIKPYSQSDCSRAQAIVDRNNDRVQGEVISEFELESSIVEKIESNSRRREIETTLEYDGSTNALVGILSGRFIKLPVKESFFSRLFSHP
jgi:hypothetical protein